MDFRVDSIIDSVFVTLNQICYLKGFQQVSNLIAPICGSLDNLDETQNGVRGNGEVVLRGAVSDNAVVLYRFNDTLPIHKDESNFTRVEELLVL